MGRRDTMKGRKEGMGREIELREERKGDRMKGRKEGNGR